MLEISIFFQEFAKQVADFVKSELTSLPAESDKNEEVWYTTEEVCKKLRITKSTLYRHRNLGYIKPAVYVGRKPLYNQESINKYLRNFK